MLFLFLENDSERRNEPQIYQILLSVRQILEKKEKSRLKATKKPAARATDFLAVSCQPSAISFVASRLKADY
jgi:hypothetical protein